MTVDAVLADPADIPHCWEQGPVDVRKLPKPRYAKRGYQGDKAIYRRFASKRGYQGDKAIYRRFAWEFLWCLNEVRGTKPQRAIDAIGEVLFHPLSWERAGVRWRRVFKPEQADILVNVIPRDETVCGTGSGGCYSWGHRGPKPIAEMGVEYIDDPNGFAELVNMELCGHGTFRMHDMYSGEGHDVNGYNGVMGTWDAARSTGYYPSDLEINEAKRWLRGQAQFVHQHSGDSSQTASPTHDHSESGHPH